MKGEESYSRFKSTWKDPLEALAYKEARFSRSRRWRWTHRREKEIVEGFLLSEGLRGLGLDVPCGAGRLASCFEMAGCAWLGSDVSLAMARLARAAGKGVLVVADAGAMPFGTGVFAFAVCVRLFHRIQEPAARLGILRELARLSRGQILLSYYTRWNLRGIQRWLRGKNPGLSLGQIRKELRGAGLRILREIPLRRATQQQWFFVVQAEESAHCPQGEEPTRDQEA